MTRTAALLSTFAAPACSGATSTPITDVVGTWGGDNAGMIVSGTADDDPHGLAHRHRAGARPPVTLIYGKEPKMGPCPICRAPGGTRGTPPLEAFQQRYAATALVVSK